MAQESVTISKEKYDKLVKKAEIADDAITQLKMSAKDGKDKKISEF